VTNFAAFSNQHFVSPRLDLNTEMPTSSIRLKNLMKTIIPFAPVDTSCIFAGADPGIPEREDYTT